MAGDFRHAPSRQRDLMLAGQLEARALICTTTSGGKKGRPGCGNSSNPARCSVKKRLRHKLTTSRRVSSDERFHHWPVHRRRGGSYWHGEPQNMATYILPIAYLIPSSLPPIKQWKMGFFLACRHSGTPAPKCNTNTLVYLRSNPLRNPGNRNLLGGCRCAERIRGKEHRARL